MLHHRTRWLRLEFHFGARGGTLLGAWPAVRVLHWGGARGSATCRLGRWIGKSSTLETIHYSCLDYSLWTKRIRHLISRDTAFLWAGLRSLRLTAPLWFNTVTPKYWRWFLVTSKWRKSCSTAISFCFRLFSRYSSEIDFRVQQFSICIFSFNLHSCPFVAGFYVCNVLTTGKGINMNVANPLYT